MDNKNIGHIKVLILDDEIDFTNEISDYLQNSGFIPFSANTPEDGYAILSKNNIDLLILDVRLPGTNGLEILKNACHIFLIFLYRAGKSIQ